MYLFALILITGLITSFTDLKSKKIYNYHLSLAALAGIILISYAYFFKHEPVLYHFVNCLLAFLIGFVLHRSEIWRGGDAKLFSLFALLMPPIPYSLPFPSVVSLFACSFIAGMVILMPVFIKDILLHHKAIIKSLILPERLQFLLRGVTRIVFYSWILFPVYYVLKLKNPAVFLAVQYLFFTSGNMITKGVKKNFAREFFRRNVTILSLVFIAGFLMRILLSPESLSIHSIVKFLLMVTISSVSSICIHTTFSHFENYHERVPFAPLLFIGCMLCYSPFLTNLMHAVSRWNVLLYH